MRRLNFLVLLMVFWGAVGWFFYSQTADSQAAPPAGFQRSLIIGSGLNGPTGFEIAPDGRIFVLERTGAVKIFKNGQLLAEPFVVLPSIASGDRGLIGIEFDPDFLSNHYVYFYYTALDKLNYLVRFDASGDVAREPEHILFQTTSPSELLHVGGSVRFGPDGKIYFAVGDNGYPPNAQDLENPHGKIHRINRDGSIPADNPFVNTAGVVKSIWAYGFRNPWRFQFDSVTGFLYGGDVGDFTWEEVNRIEGGKNYGWPLVEGFCNGCGFENPIYTYSHNGMSSAVTGGPVYRGEMFPQMYRGNLFFADYARGFIRRIELTADGSANAVHDFDTQAGTVVDLKQAPDGSLYYLTFYPGHLYRLHYSEGNSIPVVFAGSDVKSGNNPLSVQFYSTGTFDPDGDEMSFLWDFGDGNTSAEANPRHVFVDRGRYEVNLTVTDTQGNASRAIPLLVQAGVEPVVTIGTPADNSTYAAGDEITITAHAVDAFGNDLSDGNYSTDVIFHHDTHTHPFYDNLVGRSNMITIPDRGEASANTWYRIRTTVKDDSGLAGTKEINIYPRTSEVTLATSIPDVQLTLDGKPVTSPYTFVGVENFVREVGAPAQTVVNGKVYRFVRWSNDGERIQQLRTPASDTVLTAYYEEAPSWKADFYNNMEMTGAPVLTRFDAMIDFWWDEGAPAVGVNANNYSVRWSRRDFFDGGVYRFYLETDDGARVLVDGATVIDQWFDQGVSLHTYDVRISRGDHDIVFEYYERYGGAVARMRYELIDADPVPTPMPTALPSPTPSMMPDPHMTFVGEYFNNETLSGTPVLVRGDEEVNFLWHDDRPAPEVNYDNFSVRWSRHYHYPEHGVYRMCVTVDDGVRLLVENVVVIEEWKLQGATTYCRDVTIDYDHLDITLEYFEHYGGAVMQFSMNRIAGLPGSSSDYVGKYWKIAWDEPVPYAVPTRAPDLTHNDATINFVWNDEAPAAEVGADRYVAQWTKRENMSAGRYRFSATGDDGIRVYVDNVLIIDEWKLQPSTNYTAELDLTAGEHEIRVEYFEYYGGAVAQFDYELVSASTPTPTPSPTLVPTPSVMSSTAPTPSPTAGFFGEYWNIAVSEMLPYAVPTRAPDLVRNDTAIDFLWNDDAPAAEITLDRFVARWTKQQAFEAGIYRFRTRSDDGVRVWIDGNLVIDQWKLQGTTEYTADMELTAGTHDVRVEYFEYYGGAVMRFDWWKI